MLNRRNFISRCTAAVAALPIVGRFVPKPITFRGTPLASVPNLGDPPALAAWTKPANYNKYDWDGRRLLIEKYAQGKLVESTVETPNPERAAAFNNLVVSRWDIAPRSDA